MKVPVCGGQLTPAIFVAQLSVVFGAGDGEQLKAAVEKLQWGNPRLRGGRETEPGILGTLMAPKKKVLSRAPYGMLDEVFM